MDIRIVNQCIEYILNHLEDDLTVRQVAEQFHFSEYYFNREFRKQTGESIYAFVKRQKINHSAMEIKENPDLSITDVGEKYGYSASNYSTAFKSSKKISPQTFRRTANEPVSSNPFHCEKVECFGTYEEYDKNVSIQKIEDIEVLYERFFGNYADLKSAWYDFMERHAAELRKDKRMIERFYDDPKVVEVNQCICDLCIPINSLEKKEVSSGENTATIDGGKFAVYRYVGKIDGIYTVLQGVFSIWLPQSAYKMDGRYGLNIYREVDQITDQVVMDFYIPIL